MFSTPNRLTIRNYDIVFSRRRSKPAWFCWFRAPGSTRIHSLGNQSTEQEPSSKFTAKTVDLSVSSVWVTFSYPATVSFMGTDEDQNHSVKAPHTLYPKLQSCFTSMGKFSYTRYLFVNERFISAGTSSHARPVSHENNQHSLSTLHESMDDH